jgi:hypothetical protein
VPKRKRVQREHTEDWQTIQQYTLWPEQTAYELLRPVVLFGDPAIQRAQEIGYQSPQLKLWTLGPDEWLLFLRLPDYAARKKPQRKPDVIQLPLLDPDDNQRQQVSS